jgi:hypothetical protein
MLRRGDGLTHDRSAAIGGVRPCCNHTIRILYRMGAEADGAARADCFRLGVGEVLA